MQSEGVTTPERRRTALYFLFALPGLAIASWVVRTPAIRDAIDASIETMGIVILGVSIGSMVGILCSPALIARFGTRAVTGVGTTSAVLSMPVVGLGAEAGAAAVVAVGLCLFGIGMGGSEVAINTEAADVERALETSVLPAVHGCFSLGTLVGALIGVGCGLADVSIGLHLVLIGVLGVPVLFTQVRHLSPPSRSDAIAKGTTPAGWLWRDGRLLVIGVVVLAMALAEGAATDWLPLVMVDGHGASAVAGSLVYAAFAAAMTVGRFSGGCFLDRFGRTVVFRSGAAIAAAGIGCIVLLDSQALAAMGALAWGLGLSLGFPIAISAAGDSGSDPAARVAFVATMGYTAFLVGPPMLGFIGEDLGLRSALMFPLALVILAFLLASALGARDGRVREEDSAGAVRPG